MIYEEKVNIPSTTKVVKHEVAPCLKCGCDKIKIEEYEDKYGFISTAKCSSCKKELKDNVATVGIIKKWNKHNDIETLLTDKAKLIETTKEEIKSLKELQKQRQKSVRKPKMEVATK